MATELRMDLTEAQKQRILQLNELDEIRQDSLQQTTLVQQARTRWHDKFIKKKQFTVGDWAFLFDSKLKDFKGKFSSHWLGPYQIE